MKGQGIMELLAFLAIKREGIKPCRDIIFLSVADEESGGQKGVGYLLEKYPEDFVADLVINEGGYGVTGFIPDKPIFMISTAEKGICWLKVISTGPPGHASVPHGHNALEKLNMALSRLFSEEPPLRITPIISDYFKNLGAWWDFFKPFLNDGRTETLTDILAKSGLLNIPQISAMVRNTVSLTQVHSGNKTNVIPSHAEATLDLRLLPGESIDAQIQYMKKKMGDDNLTFKVLASGLPTESSKNTEYFSLIKETVLDYFSNAVVTPSLLFASSDSRFFREREITTYGFAPILVSMEDIKMVHGIDERISVDNVTKGTEVYTELVKRMCSV
jgi:acetylornithine deacetylase/succinyl-diaminopimelate desuccinylase-like protein